MLGRVISDLWHSLRRRGSAPGSSATPAQLVLAARAAATAGDRQGAVDYAEQALQLVPDALEARQLLADLYLHGRGYDAVLADIHGHLRPRTYIEIGVATGKSLRLARPETVVLGVDPDPAIEEPLPANARLYRETSDRFFSGRDVRAELGGLPVDLAFIDGLHQFDYALRDFMNLERLSSPAGTILVHDCVPLDRVSAQRERASGAWSGDVWRLIVLLKNARPDLHIHTIAAPPTGLAVIRGLDPSSRLLSSRTDGLIEEYLRLDYAYLGADRAEKLNIVPNDWELIRRLLDAPAPGGTQLP